MNNIFHPVCLFCAFAFVFTTETRGQQDLRKEIANLIQPVKGSIGVGVKHIESGDTLTVNGRDHFPMQSVYKFHLALAVLAGVDQGKLRLDQKILIQKEDFIPNTVSQIADKFPNGNVEITIEELIFYTITTSDNNACDILFNLVGGAKKVDDYFKSLKLSEVSIVNTEAEMHRDWEAQFNNWTTPREMVKLLALFYQEKILSPQSTSLLIKIMEQTSTGKKRIKGHLPAGTVVGHKTGMGGKDDIVSAVNDVGVVTLPSGEHFAIALFIANPKDSVEKLETVMAAISKLVFEHYVKTK